MRDDYLLPTREREDAADWRDRANCHPDHRPKRVTPDQWTDRWFTAIWQDWTANECATCPVQGPCADEGRHEVGMWGGVSTEVSGHQPKACKWCREPFVPLWNTEAYCCDECRRRQKNQDAARARSVARRSVT